MAQFDISKAITVKTDSGEVAGYILQHTPDLWLPLALDRENISGPTYKADAEQIVKLYFHDAIASQSGS